MGQTVDLTAQADAAEKLDERPARSEADFEDAVALGSTKHLQRTFSERRDEKKRKKMA